MRYIDMLVAHRPILIATAVILPAIWLLSLKLHNSEIKSKNIKLNHTSKSVKSVKITTTQKLKMKLYYFDVAGLGESIRLLCCHASLPLEDVRISLNNPDQFISLKKGGKLAFNQLPALEIDEQDELITQQTSIMRYLGKLCDAYPSCPIQASLVDSVVEGISDLLCGLQVSMYRDRYGFSTLDDPSVKAVRASLNNEIIPYHLLLFERIAAKSKTGWIANTEEPSIADFMLVPKLQMFTTETPEGISSDILEPYVKLKLLMEKFFSLPKINDYYYDMTWSDTVSSAISQKERS